jgi:hypothetical protein
MMANSAARAAFSLSESFRTNIVITPKDYRARVFAINPCRITRDKEDANSIRGNYSQNSAVLRHLVPDNMGKREHSTHDGNHVCLYSWGIVVSTFHLSD